MNLSPTNSSQSDTLQVTPTNSSQSDNQHKHNSRFDIKMDTKWIPILETKWTLFSKRGRCGELDEELYFRKD